MKIPFFNFSKNKSDKEGESLDSILEIVLEYPKLKERFDTKNNKESDKLRSKIAANIEEMRADFSEAYIKSLQKLLDASLPRLYDDIKIDDTDLNVKELVKDNCVVFVPNHQSHADYLAINYIVYKTYGFPLYVAGGNNLNIFPLGKIFRKSGCFFIRRSFSSDILYKLSLEAYLYYLLKKQKPIEFFFEGGRSRTGKLNPPRFGLYQMLLKAHSYLEQESIDKGEPPKKLLFLPVSIVHEHIPENKSLASELKGAKKKKENAGQLLKLVTLFSYQFGNVNIKLGKPVESKNFTDENLKQVTQDLAFSCFREVGKNMLVTPSSLLALVLLDEPLGALKWSDIIVKSKSILDYCEKYNVPMTKSLQLGNFESSLERAMDILIGNKKVDVFEKSTQEHIFYSLKEESRTEILYSKNTILHHFLVPYIINLAWINLFNGTIKNTVDLKLFFLNERNRLKLEFYLPTVKQFFVQTLEIISNSIGRSIGSLEDCFKLSHQELYSIATHIGMFSRAFNTINEAYYVCALTLEELNKIDPAGFSFDTYSKKYKEVFDKQKELGWIIKYQESYSLPMIKSSLNYFTYERVIKNEAGLYKVEDSENFSKIIDKYEKYLVEQLTFNLRL